MEDVKQNHFDSAITKSRTLLEEVFCHAIERKGQVPVTSGKIHQLYKQVKDLYNMHSDKETDQINEKYDEAAWIDVNESDRVSDDHTGRKSRLK